MKIIITGSLGHISKPLTESLVKDGHEVTVISSKSDRAQEIETTGAIAAIGSLEDVAFLSKTFTDADAVYSMVPPNNYFQPELDLLDYYRRLGKNYLQAITESGVKRVVNLSTFGAHLDHGNGILIGAHNVEQILKDLPSDVSVTHIRPTSFYYNLFGYTEMIRSQGVIAANYGAENVIPWVSPKDIAVAVAEELILQPVQNTVRYVASDEVSGNETARILGEAIGKPDLKWKLISDEETINGLTAIGMNPKIAAGLVEMYGALQSGLLAEDYYRNKPALGKVKLTEFAKEFAVAFHQKH